MAKINPRLDALRKAVDLVGTQTELAAQLAASTGLPIRQQHVWNWLNRNFYAPAEVCRAIESATAGQVTRYDLRPDVFGEAPTKEAAA